jgi:predicted transposase YbfD/YdcC
VLGQEAVEDKSCEQNAIPTRRQRLAAAGAREGALVTIDAIACHPTIADAITGNGADFGLAVKENPP